MKNISKVIATAAIAIAFSNSSFAQATATAAASATIITPITIVKNVDMNFGNVAVSASLAGTVVLLPAGTRSHRWCRWCYASFHHRYRGRRRLHRIRAGKLHIRHHAAYNSNTY